METPISAWWYWLHSVCATPTGRFVRTGRAAGRRLLRSMALATMLTAALLTSPTSALDFTKVHLDLRPLFDSSTKDERATRPLFSAIVVADLTGDGRKEIILPGTDGRLRFLRLTGTPRRPHLTVWATVDTRVEGDQWPGGCYLTAAALTKDAPASLVLALPRGIFTVRIEGEPPRPQWLPFCDRTFFDAGPTALRPRRLDFLVDLDGDGTPEIWMPQLEGMAFLRRRRPRGAPKPDRSTWEEVQLPSLSVRVRQSVGASPTRQSAVQPPLYALRFGHRLSFPTLSLTDLDSDGQTELIVLTRETASRSPILRAECFALRDALHFTTSPIQVRAARMGRGNQTFLDLNGDGFLDLLRVESNFDIVSPRTSIEVFLSPSAREHTFERPTSRYTTHDPIGMVLYGDWNGDGMTDLAYSQFDYTFGSTDDLVDLIMGREIPVTIRFLHGRPGGFPPKPDQELRLEIRNRCFHYRYFPPLSMEGDYNGDGTTDLLVRSRPERYQIHLLGGGGRRLSRRPAKSFSIADRGICRVADLDGDGRSDLLTFDPERPAITVLLSRP